MMTRLPMPSHPTGITSDSMPDLVSARCITANRIALSLEFPITRPTTQSFKIERNERWNLNPVRLILLTQTMVFVRQIRPARRGGVSAEESESVDSYRSEPWLLGLPSTL